MCQVFSEAVAPGLWVAVHANASRTWRTLASAGTRDNELLLTLSMLAHPRGTLGQLVCVTASRAKGLGTATPASKLPALVLAFPSPAIPCLDEAAAVTLNFM